MGSWKVVVKVFEELRTRVLTRRPKPRGNNHHEVFAILASLTKQEGVAFGGVLSYILEILDAEIAFVDRVPGFFDVSPTKFADEKLDENLYA
jgi:hypothetical protein